MEFEIECGDDAESLTVTASGKVTVEAVDEVVQPILADSRYRSGLRILIDSRAGEVANLTSSEARRRVDLLARDADRIGNPRIAVVLSRKVDFGVARMIESLADGRGRQCCASSTTSTTPAPGSGKPPDPHSRGEPANALQTLKYRPPGA